MNKKSGRLILLASALCAALGSSGAWLQAADMDNAATAPAVDNSKMNSGDQSAAAPTADQAKNDVADRDLMRKIRQAIYKDKSLSTYAHNVKIIAAQGKVTLKGVVHTQDEKATIESKATDIAGVGNVTNNITVKGS